MIVKVLKCAKSIRSPFFYNINKIEIGAAELIAVGNMDSLGSNQFGGMYRTLLYRESLAVRTKKPSVHLVLSADREAGEILKDPEAEKLIKQCLDEVGLGQQPYLIVKHVDTNNIHYHVVSTKIKPDGKSILWNGIGKRLVNELRKHQKEYNYLASVELHEEKEKQKRSYGITPRVEYHINYLIKNEFCSSSEEFFLYAKNRANIEIVRKPSKHINNSEIVHVRRLSEGKRIGRPVRLSQDVVDKMEESFKRCKNTSATKHKWYEQTSGIRTDLMATVSKTLDLYRDAKRARYSLESVTTNMYKELTKTWNQIRYYQQLISESKKEDRDIKAVACLLLCMNPLAGLLILLLARLEYDLRKNQQQISMYQYYARIDSIKREIKELEGRKRDLKLDEQYLLTEYLESKRALKAFNYFEKIKTSDNTEPVNTQKTGDSSNNRTNKEKGTRQERTGGYDNKTRRTTKRGIGI